MSKTSDYLKQKINKTEHLTTTILIYTAVGIIIGEIYYYLYSAKEALAYPVYALIILLAIRTYQDYLSGKKAKKTENKKAKQ